MTQFGGILSIFQKKTAHILSENIKRKLRNITMWIVPRFSDNWGRFPCDCHASRACNLFCMEGNVCRLVEDECFVAPCCPQPCCVQIKEGLYTPVAVKWCHRKSEINPKSHTIFYGLSHLQQSLYNSWNYYKPIGVIMLLGLADFNQRFGKNTAHIFSEYVKRICLRNTDKELRNITALEGRKMKF